MDSGYPLVETSNRDMEAKDGEGWGERKTSDCEECLATSMVQVWYHVVHAEQSQLCGCVNCVELSTNQQSFFVVKFSDVMTNLLFIIHVHFLTQQLVALNLSFKV